MILQDFKVVEENPLIPEALAQPPIVVSSLDLEDDWERSWSYDFLRELPSLKFLSILMVYDGTLGMFAEYWRMKSED